MKIIPEEKVMLINPDSKRGINIDKSKYQTVRKLILNNLKKNNLTHTELVNSVKRNLKGKFQGSFDWYVQVTKRDLEARKIIERIPGTAPQLYRLKK